MASLSQNVRVLVSLLIFKLMKCIQMIVLSIFLVAASMPTWLEWGFWVSPLSYGEIGLTVNEFLAPRWEKVNFNHSYCFAMTKTKSKYARCCQTCHPVGWPIGQLQGLNLGCPFGFHSFVCFHEKFFLEEPFGEFLLLFFLGKTFPVNFLS